MAKTMFDIGILCKRERFAFFVYALSSHGITTTNENGRPRCAPEFPARPNWKQVLEAWDAGGVEIAVIDDESFADKEAMVSALCRFAQAVRAKREGMRVIFVADVRRSLADPIFERLRASGVYDLVMPGKEIPLASQLCALVKEAAPAEAAYDAAGTGARAELQAETRRTSPSSPSSSAPSPSTTTSSPSSESFTKTNVSAARARNTARGKSVIAVSGIMPRAGATNCSIALARSLVMLGQAPALVVDKRTGSGLQKGYRAAASADKKSFRINGVDIFPEVGSADISRKYSHVVVDLGYLGWGATATTVDEQRKFAEFRKADLQVVYLPCTSPADFDYINKFYAASSAADLERYTIGVWGATDELFCMLQEKFRTAAPDVFMWNVDVYRWPLSLAVVDVGMVEALRPVLPRGVADKALKACAVGETAVGRGRSVAQTGAERVAAGMTDDSGEACA